MLCQIEEINLQDCLTSRAGVAEAWIAKRSDIDALTIGADNSVSAITAVVASPTVGFSHIEFEEDTAFINKAKGRNKNNVFVEVTFSFILPGFSQAIQNKLEGINGCCKLLAIVRDNDGVFHFLGISVDGTDQSITFHDMRTGEGSANTGANRQSDNKEMVETLTYIGNWYPPTYSGDVASIPLAGA